MPRTMTYAAEAMNGTLAWGTGTTEWAGVRIDSRAVGPGDLFFALAGERVDGHDFVAAALEGGAAGAVVKHPPHGSAEAHAGAGIVVDDTFSALHALTARVRDEKPEHLVAVTGSAGKTTTKELLGRMLAKRFRTAVSPGNLNNLYGFPLALLNIAEDSEWMVAEMGMSTPGELGGVSRMGRPEIAIFTNIGEAHLEQLGSLEAVVEAKAELLEGLVAGGTVVANADDPWVLEIARRHSVTGGRVLHYGEDVDEAEGNVRIGKPRAEVGGTRFSLSTISGSVDIDLRLHGLYNAWNFAAAATVAVFLGVPLAAIAEVGLEVETPPMRGRVVDLGEATLIDDCYNSNPRAFRAALASAAELPGRRRWVVAGSMLELGGASRELHRQAGRDAAEFGFEPVIGVGEEARVLVEAVAHAGLETEWYEDAEAAAGVVAERLRSGDVVLVKGSRGVGLEVVVGALENERETAGGGDAL